MYILFKIAFNEFSAFTFIVNPSGSIVIAWHLTSSAAAPLKVANITVHYAIIDYLNALSEITHR